jgi:hypothetical protein
MTQKKNKLQTHQSSREFTFSSITKPGYPLLWTSFVVIIKIDESLNNEHLQNNRSVLNMWLGSSQNLRLQINDYGIKSSYSPNVLQVCGRSSGHGKPIASLWAYQWARDFLDTYHQEMQQHTGCQYFLHSHHQEAGAFYQNHH